MAARPAAAGAGFTASVIVTIRNVSVLHCYGAQPTRTIPHAPSVNLLIIYVQTTLSTFSLYKTGVPSESGATVAAAASVAAAAVPEERILATSPFRAATGVGSCVRNHGLFLAISCCVRVLERIC